MMSENTQALPFGELPAHVGRRGLRLQTQGVAGQIHGLAAGGIERVVELRREGRERVARVELGRARGVEFRQGGQVAPDRPGLSPGAAITVPHTRTGSVLDAREEPLKDRRQLPLDVIDVEPFEIQAMSAALAVPGKSVELLGSARALHHDADRARAALRRMRDLGGEEKHITLADRDVDSAIRLDGLQHDVALELIKELRAGVVVKILARIRTAHGHDDELAVLEQQFVADGRLQQRAVLVDPGTQVERRRDVHGGIIPPGIPPARAWRRSRRGAAR